MYVNVLELMTKQGMVQTTKEEELHFI